MNTKNDNVKTDESAEGTVKEIAKGRLVIRVSSALRAGRLNQCSSKCTCVSRCNCMSPA